MTVEASIVWVYLSKKARLAPLDDKNDIN